MFKDLSHLKQNPTKVCEDSSGAGSRAITEIVEHVWDTTRECKHDHQECNNEHEDIFQHHTDTQDDGSKMFWNNSSFYAL